MLYFACDYAEGCHPKIMEALVKTNLESTPGYGEDKYCEEAKCKIREYIKCPQADIYFLVGGTQTNQLIIDSMLSNYDGVIAAETGHVAVHEAGAIEYSGHKVLTIAGHDGKMDAKALRQYLVDHYNDGSCEHMVNPGMVYLSYPTEYGTLYSKQELEAISSICKEYAIPLFVDGARLAYGLASDESDIDMSELAMLCDVFYIGGTKVGALMGEAVVFTKNNTPKHMITQIKQHGALLAKGRLLGIQFSELFTDGLYLEMGKSAIERADEIKMSLKQKGYSFYIDSPTNQIFIIMDNDKLDEFGKTISYSFWEKYDDRHTVIRLATSWATTKETVEALIKKL